MKEVANRGGLKGFDMTPKIKEHTCPECNGTGFPVVMQPAQLGRKIYPVKCKSCGGKGKITDAQDQDTRQILHAGRRQVSKRHAAGIKTSARRRLFLNWDTKIPSTA